MKNKDSQEILGFNPKDILRYPRLDTVLMVEKAIRDADDYPTKTELWHSLPKKTMYQTFSLILDYLLYSGKIYVDENDGKIMWIWNPELVRKIVKNKNLVVK